MRVARLFLPFTLFMLQGAQAQQPDTTVAGKIIRELTDFWAAYVPGTFVTSDTTGISDVRQFLNAPAFVADKSAARVQGKMEENQLRAQILRTDWGLKFSAGYMENFSPAFNDEDNLLYNRRVQAGVNWDLLNSGLAENRALAKAKELENLILQSALLRGHRTEDLTVKWNQVIYLFNTLKIKILHERLLLVQEQNKAARSLFLARYLTKETYLENEKRLAEIQAMLKVYKDFNTQIESLGIKPGKNIDFPLVDLKYEAVFAGPTPADALANDSLMRLILEKNTLKNRYLNEMNLGPYVRYNYYNLITSNPASRNFMSAGINLSLPLYFRGKLRQQYIAQQSVNEYEALTGTDETQQINVLDDIYEFRYKLKQYVVFHQKKLLFAELLRKENARRSIDPVSFNPYRVISLQDDILSIDIELAELRQNMYLKLLMIGARGQRPNLDQVYQCLVLPEHLSYVDTIKKSVYAWSSVFEKYDTAFITEYLRFHNIRSFAVSQGNNTSLQSLIKSTVRSLKKTGIETELLIGDNRFADKKIEDYFTHNGLMVNDITALHIDYEPHTFSDWEQNKDTYMQSYLQALKLARDFCDRNGLKLKVDIPLHYREQDVKEMLALCDQVCFMAYENIKSGYISGKINVFAAAGPKLAIALRTNDFTGRAQMEEKMSELVKLTGITEYYMHDLTRCIGWDEKAVEEK